MGELLGWQRAVLFWHETWRRAAAQLLRELGWRVWQIRLLSIAPSGSMLTDEFELSHAVMICALQLGERFEDVLAGVELEIFSQLNGPQT